MKPGRFAAIRGKEDANAHDVRVYLLSAGASVRVLPIGGGLPDFLVGYWGWNDLAEVKRPAGPRGGLKDRHLRGSQEDFNARWNGTPPFLLRDAEDAEAMLNAIRKRGRPAWESVRPLPELSSDETLKPF